MEALIIHQLSKTYNNGLKALQDISLEIPKGLFGLLGPNGAGKSSLMRTIATLQDADEGTIHLGEINVLQQKMELRKVLGYLPQDFGLYPKISAECLLDHLAMLKGVVHYKTRKKLVRKLLHQVHLFKERKEKLGTFSGGMKRRFGIAQALINTPKLLIVDEPTAGLDPSERYHFFDLLNEFSEQTIVILSTHIVDDVKALCTKMAIIEKGEIILQGQPLHFIEKLSGQLFQKHIPKDQLQDYQNKYQVISHRLLLGKMVIHVKSDQALGCGFQRVKASLEDVYMDQIKSL
ncbi:MAG: ABC transporter ATP-binding protein [Bacteroidota bacterium]